MNKRLAVLDLGTNTFHLLIAESRTGIEIIYQETIAVKLGEGGINSGTITGSAYARGMEALKKFSRIIKEYGAEEVRAAGTAALRSASNGKTFIAEVYRETGICIRIIEGDTEAQLIYEGVKQGIKMGDEPGLIMDIGGGSVEFILCNAAEIFWKKSYPLGAAKLMDKFHHHDPLRQEEIAVIEKHLDEQTADLKQACLQYKPLVLIGSAGAFETFAALIVQEFGLPVALLQQTEFVFDRIQFSKIANEILTSTHAARAANPAIIPVRIDMIVVSTVITRYILKELQLSEMKLSTYALKEGLLFGPSLTHEA